MDQAHNAGLGIFTAIQEATYLVRAPQDLRAGPGVAAAAAGAAARETGARDSFLQREERVEPGVQGSACRPPNSGACRGTTEVGLTTTHDSGSGWMCNANAGSSGATPALPQHWRVPSHPSHGSTPTPPSSCHLRPADRRLPLLQP